MLIVIGLGAYIFLSESAYTYRYLFPGLLGFGLFVIFPIAYMVFLSFTKYSSKNLLTFDRSVELFLQESFPEVPLLTNISCTLRKTDNTSCTLKTRKIRRNALHRSRSILSPGKKLRACKSSLKLTALAPGEEASGKPLEMGQITREKLFMPMRTLQFALPDDRLVGMEGLTKFGSRERLWILNEDGSLTNKRIALSSGPISSWASSSTTKEKR